MSVVDGMEFNFSWYQLLFFFLLYSFLGWLVEVGCYGLIKRRFYNRGVATQPLLPTCGVIFTLLILVLPTLGGNYIFQFLAVLVIVAVMENLSEQLFRHISPKLQWGAERERLLSGSGKGVIISLLIAGAYFLTYLVVHPLLLAFTLLLPALLVKIVVITECALLLVDFSLVVYAVRTGDAGGYQQLEENSRQSHLAARLTRAIWRRLQKAYPGIQQMSPQEQVSYPFARGVCLDKLVWVFLISALLGDLIETFYCGLVDGQWMSRSSVLYGPFSFVWGLGAVVLTVTLQRLAEKHDRYVFLAGFLIGGAYEYMCSVFTELVFGTVFWDYSEMPLNIGGRTNVLFCFFWGVLAVVWVKVIYPPMSRGIERTPALVGKVLTWVTVFVMACNGALTCAAMVRHGARSIQTQPANMFEEFLDNQYGDAYMARRWPNMIAVAPEDG